MSATPRSTRREFLQGQAAAEALVDAVQGSRPAGDFSASRPDDGYLMRLARRAMACDFEIFFNAGQYQNATEAALVALDRVDQLEDQLSIYREQSEVSRLNRAAFHDCVAVESRLFALLETALGLHRITAGAYDVTAGQLSRAWGFTRRAGAIPSLDVLDVARRRVGSEFLELDREALSVHFLRDGLEINLGGIGKGYALDRCAELLDAAGIHDYLLHGGNSSVLARGSRGGQPAGWSVGLRDPLHPGRRLGQLSLQNRALGTSGSGTQFFVHEGRRYGHIIDPRSGWPAEGVLSVTVLAPTATEADALATAFYVMGPEATGMFCREHAQFAAVMFCPGARLGSVDRHCFGIDEPDWIESPEP